MLIRALIIPLAALALGSGCLESNSGETLGRRERSFIFLMYTDIIHVSRFTSADGQKEIRVSLDSITRQERVELSDFVFAEMERRGESAVTVAVDAQVVHQMREGDDWIIVEHVNSIEGVASSNGTVSLN